MYTWYTHISFQFFFLLFSSFYTINQSHKQYQMNLWPGCILNSVSVQFIFLLCSQFWGGVVRHGKAPRRESSLWTFQRGGTESTNTATAGMKVVSVTTSSCFSSWVLSFETFSTLSGGQRPGKQGFLSLPDSLEEPARFMFSRELRHAESLKVCWLVHKAG